MKYDPSHKTRSSDSSFYDEICLYCGATDGRGDRGLYKPCPNTPKPEPSLKQQTNDRFMADICESPEDWTLRRIYADWLEDNGEPELARCLRWMADNRKRSLGLQANSDCYWYKCNPDKNRYDQESDLPDGLFRDELEYCDSRLGSELAFQSAWKAAVAAGWKPEEENR